MTRGVRKCVACGQEGHTSSSCKSDQAKALRAQGNRAVYPRCEGCGRRHRDGTLIDGLCRSCRPETETPDLSLEYLMHWNGISGPPR